MGLHEMKKMSEGETAHDVLIHPAWDLLSRPRFWPATTPLTDFVLVLTMKGSKNVMNFTANGKNSCEFPGKLWNGFRYLQKKSRLARTVSSHDQHKLKFLWFLPNEEIDYDKRNRKVPQNIRQEAHPSVSIECTNGSINQSINQSFE